MAETLADQPRYARPPAQAAAGRREARSAFRAPMAWGIAGFLIGIAFWHMVGFWSFVSRVVFKGSAPVATIARSEKAGRSLDGQQHAARQGQATCVELRLSRSGAGTTTGPCGATAQLVRPGPLAGRGDRALPRLQMMVPSVAGWSTQIDATRQEPVQE